MTQQFTRWLHLLHIILQWNLSYCRLGRWAFYCDMREVATVRGGFHHPYILGRRGKTRDTREVATVREATVREVPLYVHTILLIQYGYFQKKNNVYIQIKKDIGKKTSNWQGLGFESHILLPAFIGTLVAFFHACCSIEHISICSGMLTPLTNPLAIGMCRMWPQWSICSMEQHAWKNATSVPIKAGRSSPKTLSHWSFYTDVFLDLYINNVFWKYLFVSHITVVFFFNNTCNSYQYIAYLINQCFQQCLTDLNAQIFI